MLAAGDTFRAAAAEQLQGWAQRSKSQLVARADDRQKPDSLLRVALDRVCPALPVLSHTLRSHLLCVAYIAVCCLLASAGRARGR